VVLSFLYWLLWRLLELLVLRMRSEREKEIEILVLRHQLRLLERVGFVNSAVVDLQGNRAGGRKALAGDRTGSSRRRWPLHPSP